jgi:hypothetical protein
VKDFEGETGESATTVKDFAASGKGAGDLQ